MTLQELKNLIPDYAKDVRLNLGSVLSEEGAPGLSLRQILGVAVASAYTLKHQPLMKAITQHSEQALSEAHFNGAKSAAAIMAMNNIYYRYLHLSKDAELMKLPARLRMNSMVNHGIEKTDYELYSLAASILTGCESCIKSHIREVRDGGISNEGIQSTARIASVLNSTVQVLDTHLHLPQTERRLA